MLDTLEKKQNNTNLIPSNFLGWLFNRLKFKYHEDETILYQIKDIYSNYILFPKKIPIDIIDKICKKHYPDFDIDKTPDLNIGYTNNERLQIKQFIVSVIEDVSKL